MNSRKWLRPAALAAVAGSVVAASSIASAQYNPKRAYCREYALNYCSMDANGHPITPTLECYDSIWQWCMDDFAKVDVRKPGDLDRRRA